MTSRFVLKLPTVFYKITTIYDLMKLSYREVFGFPITEYYRKIGIDFQKESFEELVVKFISHYNSQVIYCDLHQDVSNVLIDFESNNIQQYILTATHKENVLELLSHFSIQDLFKEVEGLDNHRAESKVERGIKLIENNHFDCKETVMVGDTIHDYDVACEIGVDCILIANGHQSKRRLEEKANGQIPVLNEISELKEIFL